MLPDIISYPFYCTRCSRRQRRAQNIPRAQSSFLTAMLLLATSLAPIDAQAQQVYTPRYNAGSSIANNTLFVVSGTISMTPPFTATADTLAIPLNSAFTTATIPWKKLQAGYFVQDARVVATGDQTHLVLAGVGDQVGQVVVIFDISANAWSYLPATAAANIFPQTQRTSVGITMDMSTGLMVLYGGMLSTGDSFSLSMEFDFLDTRPMLNNWSWLAAISSAQPPPPLFQPIMLYLPAFRATLVMGGCSAISPVDGSITACAPFASGYLINSMIMTNLNGTSIPMTQVAINGPYPAPRLSPCTAVLASGDVFMYGGATPTGSLGDAWVLKTRDWTWVPITINNIPFPGRAGATCQLATADQMILVGGFDGGLTGPRQFSEPQIAIINTTSWTWTSNFTPATIMTPRVSELSLPATIGIIVGCTLVLAVLFLIIGRQLWLRHKQFGQRNRKVFESVRASPSREPLMDRDEPSYEFESTAASTPMVLFSTPRPPNTSATRESRTTLRQKEREPFLILPYAPDSSTSSSPSSTVTFSTTDMTMESDTIVGNSMPIKPDFKYGNPYGSKGSSEEVFRKGYQLPQMLADIQHGQYIKTLQHQKQYEKRRQEIELQRISPLHRTGTQYTIYGHDADNEGELDLATGVVNLREVDLGEEPIVGAWNGVDDGTILLSSHLDTSKIDSSDL